MNGTSLLGLLGIAWLAIGLLRADSRLNRILDRTERRR